MRIADIIKQLVFVTVRWIIQTTVLLRIKFVRRMLFIGAVGDLVLFVLVCDVCHDQMSNKLTLSSSYEKVVK